MTAERYDHVIVGAGMAGDAAARGIHEVDPTASILVVGREPTPPVARPPLSKGLWTDPAQTLEGAYLPTRQDTGAELLLATEVTAVDPSARTVTLGDGTVVGYGSLLLATSGPPTQLDGVHPGERVLYYRTVRDYERLREVSVPGAHVVVVGGGYIGTEIAAALTTDGTRVTLVHRQEVLTGAVFPPGLARRVEQSFVDAGVDLRPRSTVVRVEVVEGAPHAVEVHLADGSVLTADAVVVGAGITPDASLARAAGLALADGGVEVDEQLRTSDPHVFAAGDVASYPDPILGRRRVEHEDQAVSSGRQAGRNMAGAGEPYTHTPSYYSDLFDAGYEAVGTLDARLTTVEDWRTEGQEGVVYYVDGDRVAGVLLWNVWDSTDQARDVIAHQRDVSPHALRGRIGARPQGDEGPA